MKHSSRYNALFTIAVAGILASACSHHQSSEAVVATTTSPSEDPAEKAYAPVQLHLASSALTGSAELTLTLTPQADLPNAHVRLVLPPEVTLREGTAEVELGALSKGQKIKLAFRVDIPDQGSFDIAAGVETQLSPARKLARSVVLPVGTPGKEREGPVKALPEGGSVRVQQ